MNDIARPSSSRPAFLEGAGEMGTLIREHDWSASLLGPIETWPQSLQTLLGFLLRSPIPMVLLWGEDGVMLYNDAYSVFAASRHPELLGSKVREGWPEVAAFNDNVMKVGLAGGTLHYRDQELTLHRRGRPEQVWMNLDYSPVLDESGEPAGVLCVVAEITERIAAEQRREAAEAALRAERDRSQGVLDNMGEAFVLLDREFRIVDMNAEAMRLENRPKEAILGKTHWEAHPDAAPELGELYRQAMRERRAAALEHHYVWPDGRDTWIDMRAYPAGKGLAVFYRDVTDRKRIETALAEQEQELRTLTDALPVLVSYIDAERRYRFNNRIYETWFPRKRDDIVGRSVREVVGEAAYAKVAHHMDAALRGERVTFDQFMPYADRAGRHIEVEYIPRQAPDGSVEGFYTLMQDVTARKTAEEALRQSEARLSFLDRLSKETAALAEADAVLATTTRLVGEHMRVSVCAYAAMDEDQDGFTIRGDWAAPGSRSIVGHYSLADFGKLAVANLGAGRPLVVNDNLRELAPEEAATFQSIGIAATICMPLGKEGRLTALMAIHDKVPRVWTTEELALLREVTERSWAYVERVGTVAELRESEARFQAIANSIDQMVWSTRPDGFHDFYNQRWYDYTGVPEGSTDGEGWNDVFHPEDQERAWAVWRQSLETGGLYHIEYRLRHRSGQYRWVLGRAQPVRDGNDHITRWYGTCTDIQDIVEAREVLARSRDELEQRVAGALADRNQLWTLSADMLARADFQGVMSAVSPAWTRVLGWSEMELLSRPYSTFMHPEDTEVTLAALARMGETGQPTRFENRIATADGGWKPVEWTVAPEPDSPSFIAVGRDLSEVRAQEDELRQAQEALRQSQKMEAVGQLTGGLAHDFNNLLAGISGSLELMATRISQGRLGEVERYMVAAQGAARRAAALTHRLLAFSRRQTLAPKVTDVNVLVTGMEDLIRRTVGPQIAVEGALGGDLWNVLVDAPQLENALLNLCINARDAMPDGGKLTIETGNRWLDDRAARTHDLPPGQYVSLCVSDNGTGMAANVIAKAFDPFFTTKPLGVGTGLGLSMVYGFARQSGGQVRITSELGQSTTVCLYLPRHLGEADGAEINESDAPAVSPAQVGATVLVVDDEPVVRMLIVDVLEELGYAALEAGDGPEGLKVLQSKARVDLLVSDVSLPGGLNGRQVADAARALRPGLKVLFITGYAENAVLNNGHLEPGMQVVTKPFQVEELGRRIRAILSED